MRSLITGILVILICSVGMTQEVSPDQVSVQIDWTVGRMTVQIRRSLPLSGHNMPAAISQARAEVQRDAPDIIAEQIRQLPYDSLLTVDEMLNQKPELITAITAVADGARLADAHATPDMRSIVVTYELNLFSNLLAAIIGHDRPIPLPRVIGWIPSTDYTGIIIYAAGELPLHGTDETVHLQPTLLPGIYYASEDDAGVERLMEAGHLAPESVREWGPVLYASNVTDAELSARIGGRPLTIVAYGAFGRYPTDVVISREDAWQILYSDNNRSLITQGRVALILDPQMLTLQ